MHLQYTDLEIIRSSVVETLHNCANSNFYSQGFIQMTDIYRYFLPFFPVIFVQYLNPVMVLEFLLSQLPLHFCIKDIPKLGYLKVENR